MALLSVFTIGAYVPIWFGLTWAELRRESGDGRMFPLGHGLSLLVPGWNAWQAWRHFRAIDGLLARGGGTGRGVDAASAALGVAIWWLTFTHYSSDPVFLLFDAVELTAGTAVIVYGQRALNAHWAARGGEERLLDTDILALLLASAYALMTIVSVL
ncbi:MAG TPA: hypothetical protein VFM06_07760 [Candidatus Limnocylindria bacterium]|nr:hypothetical protein [Candidatus Limnocylindria bacterium]